jgi:maleate cis-trans isomerase
VVTSNQATAWNMLRLAGIKDQYEGFGRIFSDY